MALATVHDALLQGVELFRGTVRAQPVGQKDDFRCRGEDGGRVAAKGASRPAGSLVLYWRMTDSLVCPSVRGVN